jgi:hypothetical protein
MDLKLFGRAGVPDEDFTKALKVLLQADEQAWDELGNWFLTTESFDDDAIGSSTSSLLPEQFSECVYALRFILEAWQIHGLQVLDIQRDLFSLGYDHQKVDKVASLLRRIEPVKERAYKSYIRFENENAVLPTLEDIDIVCDVRAIFEDYVYPAPAKATGVDYRKLIGFSYLLLVELVTEDADGENRKLAFQMSEKSLADLQSALERAREQLNILKEVARALPVDHH